MSEGAAGMIEKRKGKYLTAVILATFALGLFLFTLFSGLK